MCGISGFINKDKKYMVTRALETLVDITYYNRLRGTDAFGMFKVDQSKQWKSTLLKKSGDPFDLLLKDKDFEVFTKWTGDNTYLVAHNRLATKGEKNNPSHAQPFEEKRTDGSKIILVHNGTLTHVKNEKVYSGVTDSHSLTKLMTSGMPLADVEAHIWGAWATCWYDSADHTLNFWRNNERPFGFVIAKDSVWFGSEVYSIAAGMDRKGIGVVELHRLPHGEHWKWHQDELKFEKTKVVLKTKSYHNSSTHTITPASSMFNDNEFEGDPTAMSPVTGGTKSGAAGVAIVNNRTPVTPYSPPMYHPGNRQTARKGHFSKVEEIMGIPARTWIIFSLCSMLPTKRGNQTTLMGKLVAYTNDGAPILETSIDVEGMVGMRADAVAGTSTFWNAEVSECLKKTTTGKADLYKFLVKNIKNTQTEDPFRDFQRSGTTASPALFTHAKGGAIMCKLEASYPEDDPVMVSTPIVKRGEGEFADGKDQTCGDCKAPLTPGNKYKLKHKGNANTLYLCGGCLRKAAQEDERADKIMTALKRAELQTQTNTFH